MERIERRIFTDILSMLVGLVKCLPDLRNKMHTQASIWKIPKANYLTLHDY